MSPFTTSTSRGSSRGSSATISSPAGISVGRSFSECTQQWTLPFARSDSSSFVNSPFAADRAQRLVELLVAGRLVRLELGLQPSRLERALDLRA